MSQDPKRAIATQWLARVDCSLLAAPDWSLDRAALTMVDGGFRHLIVVDGADVVGILSVRDVVRCWTADGATCELS